MDDAGLEEEEEEGEEEEGEREEETNMMNDSLLQVYRHDNSRGAPCTLTPDAVNSVPSTGSHSCQHEVGPAHFSLGGILEEPYVINWGDDGAEGIPTGEMRDIGGGASPVVLGSTPIAVIDTTPAAALDHVTHHVTLGTGHVTGVVEEGSEGGGGVVSGGEGREGGVESERRLKKVTFAPDVLDKQTSSILKVGGHVPLLLISYDQPYLEFYIILWNL